MEMSNGSATIIEIPQNTNGLSATGGKTDSTVRTAEEVHHIPAPGTPRWYSGGNDAHEETALRITMRPIRTVASLAVVLGLVLVALTLFLYLRGRAYASNYSENRNRRSQSRVVELYGELPPRRRIALHSKVRRTRMNCDTTVHRFTGISRHYNSGSSFLIGTERWSTRRTTLCINVSPTRE